LTGRFLACPSDKKWCIEVDVHGSLDGRPSAKEWQQHLDSILSGKGLARCPRYPNDYKHIRFTGMPCPQCQIDALGANRQAQVRRPPPEPNSTREVTRVSTGAQTSKHAVPSKLDFFSIFDFLVKLVLALLLLFAAIKFFGSSSDSSVSSPNRVTAPAVKVPATRSPQASVSPAPRSQQSAGSSANQWTPPTVAQVQTALHRLGFNPGPIDGVMGPRTQRAIRDFQRSRNLVADGRITYNLDMAIRIALRAR